MELPLRFSVLRPAETEGDLVWAWHLIERDLDRQFWAQSPSGAAGAREEVFLAHWLVETANGYAFQCIADGSPLLCPEQHAHLLEALHADALAYQQLICDGLSTQMPVAQNNSLVPVVIHLIRGWYPTDDVQESFRVLAAWESEATTEDTLDVLESLPHLEIPPYSVLARIRSGERPPIKPRRAGASEPVSLEDALWPALEKICADQPERVSA
ncbi:MAG: hypothetical protein L0G49_10630 [Luteococcus sp.]|uniref:hypothetical protein n=1 Tax=Luteococcus sp. TaxID=1969402 RepID=UPI002649A536|nr:hypothetical protein [Luteococcus sp.]MDN5564207.1 hypothetical protein [Luteococcus sp.]